MAEEKTAISCPNCQGPAIKHGNEITCEACDATYKITKTGAARVKETGKIEDHESRLKHLESLLPGKKIEPSDNGDESKKPAEEESDIIPG